VDLCSDVVITPLIRRSGMARVLKGSHSFNMHTPLTSANGILTIPAFAFSAKAGTHFPTPEGWKAELALVAGCS